MMRSMFSGVSGLKTHQAKMDVIGNNIANVNTVGFKAGRATFKEVFSQTIKGSGGADSATGRAGTNPMQIGLGVGLSSIDTVMTRGSSERTDNPTDLSIEGDGFFIVKGSNSDTYKFTRAGDFSIDELGNLNLNGNSVCGWEYDSTLKDFDTNTAVKGINLYRNGNTGTSKKVIAAKATDKAYLGGNINSTTSGPLAVPMVAYDQLGNEYKTTVSFTKSGSTATGTTWTVTVPSAPTNAAGTSIGTAAIGTVDSTVTPPTFTTGATYQVAFNADGTLNTTATGTTANMGIQITPTGTSGTGPFTFKLDVQGLTGFASDSTAKPTDVNGYPPGTLTTFNVGTDGIITGIYSNGEQQALGMVAVTTFPNPGGLTKVGDNLFIPSTNSGGFTKGVKPGSDGAGTLNPGTLEMSNVDLSKEFTDMIITQRGFQANSRIITASDEMLQELVNLKR